MLGKVIDIDVLSYYMMNLPKQIKNQLSMQDTAYMCELWLKWACKHVHDKCHYESVTFFMYYFYYILDIHDIAFIYFPGSVMDAIKEQLKSVPKSSQKLGR